MIFIWLVLVLRIKGNEKLGWVRIGVLIKWYFSFLKVLLYFVVYLNILFFFVNWNSGLVIEEKLVINFL